MAQTGNLYGSGTSGTAVLVRLINARENGPVVLRFGSERLEAPAPGTVSSYHGIVADVYILRYEGKVLEFIPRTGTLYTIIATESRGLLILEDTAHSDVARSQIYFYNMAFSDQAGTASEAGTGLAVPTGPEAEAGLSIKTADGEYELFRSVQPGSSSHLAVNAVRVQMAVFDNTNLQVSSPFEPELRRGASTTVLVMNGPGGTMKVFTVLANIANR
jgi:hypothetical protein